MSYGKNNMYAPEILSTEGLLASKHAYTYTQKDCDYITSIAGVKCISGKNFAAGNSSNGNHLLRHMISILSSDYKTPNGTICTETAVVADGNMVFKFYRHGKDDYEIVYVDDDKEWKTDLSILYGLGR